MDVWTIICAVVVVVLTIIYCSTSDKRRRLPPGPVGFPIVGCYPYMRKDSLQRVNVLCKKYGPIFGFYMGSQYVVVVSGWKAALDVCSKVLARPPDLFKNVPYHFGMVGSNGSDWLEGRRMSSKALKDMGLHDTRWDYMSQENANFLIESLLRHGEKPIDINLLFYDAFLRNMLPPLVGEDISSTRDTTRILMKSVEATLANTTTIHLSNFSPTLFKVLQMLGIEKGVDLKKELMDMHRIVSDTVDQKINNPSGVVGDSFISQMEHEINQRAKHINIGEHTKDYLIKGNVLALIIAGSDTTRTAMIWLLIAMAENPEVQKKVHDEVDRVLGKDGTVVWTQRKEMPYTLAAILEVNRWKSIAPIPAMRMTTEDIEVQSYIIPKGTYIAINVWGLHYDTTYWNEPDRFIPERFLLEDGKNVRMSPNSYAPFSIGKRNCPGKTMALMQMFQYFCVIMQRFKVMPKQGNTVQYDIHLGLTYEPANVKLCFIPRQ